MKQEADMKLLCMITDGFEDIEAIGTIALLRRAGLDVTVGCIDDTKAMGRYGTEVVSLTDYKTLQYNDFDMLVIPGGPEYIKEEANPEFLAMVKEFYRNDKYIAAICAGPTILGHLGMLNGKNYTCFTSMNENFGGTYLDQYVVTDGKFITARSCAATIDFALEIIRVLLGEKALSSIKAQIYYER